MGIDRQSSKSGGGYVGGFLQLFDWNGRSHKKLFSNKTDLPAEGSKQGKKSYGNLPMTRLRLVEEDENGGSSIKGSSDYSCASSVTDDEGNGTRAPGVVARLMGLDSLPTSNTAEPYSTPFFDSHSLRDANYHRRTPEFHNEENILHSSNQLPEFEGFSRNLAEPRPPKMQSRSIERFQTETLPPKSAKSIPITHHKLLSPIKSPGFIPSKNAAHIMEAAAKIIEPGPQSTSKGKMPSIGSTSIPLKVRDFKEKIQAAQRPTRLPEARKPVDPSAAKYFKGQSLTKSWNGSEDKPRLRTSLDSEENSSVGLKNKAKSVSLAIQAKVNVQRREGSGSNSSRNPLGQKEHNDVKANQPSKNQPNAQKNTQKKASIQGGLSVLRQNNQKQNCLTTKDKVHSKPSVSQQQGRKPPSGDASGDRTKTLNKAAGNSKVGSRRTGLEASNVEKIPSSRTKSVTRKKRSVDGDFQFKKNGMVDTVIADKDEKPILSNVDRLGQSTGAEDNKWKGMDVVSFTFTSPMIKGVPASQSSSKVEKNSVFSVDSCGDKIPSDVKNAKPSSLGLNVIGGDALSILLEQKLRELTYGVGSSYHNTVKTDTATSSASILEDLVSALNAVGTSPGGCNNGSQIKCNDKFGSSCDPACSSTDAQELKMSHKLLGQERMSKCNSDPGMETDLHPSPISVLEPSFSNESCSYSDSGDSGSTNGSKQCSSVQDQEVIGSSHPGKFQPPEAETELSDSASSTSTGTRGGKFEITYDVAGSTQSEEWELEYVREILCNVELMFKDFTLGRACEIINPHLFDQLENCKLGLGSEAEEDYAPMRKMVFECVSECLDIRCRRYAGGGSKTWAKGVAMVQRKGWLAEEVCKEISGWRSMGDWVVDELVDKDMSSQDGRWFDFEIEAFEVGVAIET
ncbi:uncharacterized protein LOC122667163 isoform X2 [Telopea speciosissima]|uniref:uncharacterized protein LOC122667163 isoform X2 n=1 Tax=Telopea speciosissima TaxID=54955 RepID=UPI001CC35547|nr:uncharacterized protein LOC122667163 isoform X2 [Telopea speciosissima]